MNPKIEMYAVSTQTNNTISMESDGDFGIHMKVNLNLNTEGSNK